MPKTQFVSGVLELAKRGGALRDPAASFQLRQTDPIVSASMIERWKLPAGAFIEGQAAAGQPPRLVYITRSCGLPLKEFVRRTPFERLTSVDPHQRYRLSKAGRLSLRVIDLFAPLGRGSRAMIVSPPKAGKTTLMQDIATGIHADDPEVELIILLIDERPEEETHWRRSMPGRILCSRSDQTPKEHMRLVQLAYSYVRCQLECGRHVAVLIDSLTRMARAFNLGSSGQRGIMTGGVEAGALELPRRFLGLARSVEGGGSVTIVGTVLVDTGSRMDNLIFEEFKGTGNSEIILDRSLAERRLFPAIDLLRSGTRKEEKLLSPEETRTVALLRRSLAARDTRRAMLDLLTALKKFPSNEGLMDALRV